MSTESFKGSEGFKELVDELAAVVTSGSSKVDELLIDGLPENLRALVREAVRIEVKRLEEDCSSEVEKSENVTGGMKLGENAGGYRFVTAKGKRFVGSPEETQKEVRAHLENEAKKGSDFGPAELKKLYEALDSDGESIVYGENRYEAHYVFGGDGVFLFELEAPYGRLLKVIIEVDLYGYAKIKAIDDRYFMKKVDKNWVKRLLINCELEG